MPNMGRNAVTKSIGTVKRIEPPQSEIKNAVAMITEGMEINIVVVWKNAVTALAMPVSHM
jgi:translation elongation factor P/translation initiation factor 5A